jgi:hypothetical protein
MIKQRKLMAGPMERQGDQQDHAVAKWAASKPRRGSKVRNPRSRSVNLDEPSETVSAPLPVAAPTMGPSSATHHRTGGAGRVCRPSGLPSIAGGIFRTAANHRLGPTPEPEQVAVGKLERLLRPSGRNITQFSAKQQGACGRRCMPLRDYSLCEPSGYLITPG